MTNTTYRKNEFILAYIEKNEFISAYGSRGIKVHHASRYRSTAARGTHGSWSQKLSARILSYKCEAQRANWIWGEIINTQNPLSVASFLQEGHNS